MQATQLLGLTDLEACIYLNRFDCVPATRDVPLWVIGSVFGLLAILAFTGLRWSLQRQTQADLGAYSQLVKLAPQPANVTITLP